MLPNFKIISDQKVSQSFLKIGIDDLFGAAEYIRQLPYGRNADKTDLLCVVTECKGTCSTKHALLKELAIENNAGNVRLMLAIIKMSGTNTPPIAATLHKAGLKFMPEAHNYLRVNGIILDCTETGMSGNGPKEALAEIEIQPHEITEFKVRYHKNYLQHWLSQNRHIRYSLDELYAIREQCIKDLQG